MNFDLLTSLLSRYINSLKNYYYLFNDYFNTILRLIGIYVIWILAHYFASHLYIRWCVQSSFLGFLMSPFLVPAPQCRALRWIVINGALNINAMWLFLSTWIIDKINPFRIILTNNANRKI